MLQRVENNNNYTTNDENNEDLPEHRRASEERHKECDPMTNIGKQRQTDTILMQFVIGWQSLKKSTDKCIRGKQRNI